MHSPRFTHILLICKTKSAAAENLAVHIADWLEQNSYVTTILRREELDSADLSREKTLAIVLGGDGTMIGVGRKLAAHNIPIFGINFGKVGFITNASPKNWKSHLKECLSGKLPLQPRLILNWRHLRNQKLIQEGCAVNDVVLSHGELARLVSIEILINGESMGSLRCDGAIFATPVGSTGYSASAGGPILFAKTDAFVFTPICPFLRSVAPMVFPSSVVSHIRIDSSSPDCCLTIDGQEGFRVQGDDLVEISATPNAIPFFGKEEVFFERLRSRGLALEQTYAQE